MPIKYDKMIAKLEAAGLTSGHKIRKSGLMGQATYYNLINGHATFSMNTIDRICNMLKCQPGELMEWVPEDD